MAQPLTPTIKYAEEKWASAKFDGLEKDLDETKSLALSARRTASEPHVCNQLKEIEDMKAQIAGWNKWWKATVIVVIGGILTIVGFVWSVDGRADEFERGMDDVRQSVQVVTDKVGDIAENQAQMQTGFDRRDKNDSANLKGLQELLQKTIEDSMQRHGGGRRRR
jgi:hypothetical protein